MSDREFISNRLKRLLRQLLWAILTFALVTACGADYSQVNSVPSPDTKQTAPADSIRLVQHMMGETQVPVNPQRVVTLDGGYLANALVLGIQPIGSAAWSHPKGGSSDLGALEPYLHDGTQKLTTFGYNVETELETVLLLKPDLIMGSHRHEAIYKQLSRIAPTVLYDHSGQGNRGWKEMMRFSGEVFGKSQTAEKVLNDYDQRTQELRQKLRQKTGDSVSTIQISAVHPVNNGARLMYKRSLGGTVLEDVGLSRPPSQDQEGAANALVSFELIPHLDGDVIFVISYVDDDSVDRVNELKNQPLWSQLEAVKQGKVYPVNAQHWYGVDIMRVNLILDDLFKYLLEEE